MIGNKRVVITGIGPLASAGIGKEQFWKGILNKDTGLELVKAYVDGKVWDEFYIHKINNFNIKEFGLDNDVLEYIEDWKETAMDMDLQYLLAAVKLTIDDAKIDSKIIKNELGLIVTNEHPAMEDFCRRIFKESFIKLKSAPNINEKEFWDYIYYKVVKSAYETQTFMPLYHIARAFDIHRYSLYVNNACASGLYAIEVASQMIKLNRIPMVVVTAGDHPNIFKHLWFKMLDMYESDGKVKPFSKGAKGLVMGEGSAGLMLEDYEHAIKRNAHIYAEYLGGGFRLGGWQIARPRVGDFFYHEAIKEAISNSQINEKEIDLICPHGFGGLVNDFYEAKAIMEIFGKDISVTTFKPYIGHNLGGSTLLETIILLLCLENNVIVPILNTKEVNPQIDLNLILTKKDWNLNTVMKTCSAFAGYNAANIFRKVQGL